MLIARRISAGRLGPRLFSPFSRPFAANTKPDSVIFREFREKSASATSFGEQVGSFSPAREDSGSHSPWLSRDELPGFIKNLSADESNLNWTLRQLKPKTKQRLLRSLLLSYTDDENQTQHADRIFMILDDNRDGYVTEREFRMWCNQYYLPGLLREKDEHEGSLKLKSDNVASTSPETDQIVPIEPIQRGEDEDEEEFDEIQALLPRRTLLLILLRSSIPYVVFGMLDNSLMLIFGEYIDHTIGVSFCLTTMTAAGLGNMLSATTGILAGGFIERLTYGLGAPKLSRKQAESAEVRNAHYAGSVLGISLGCLIGMFPLLFIDAPQKNSSNCKCVD